MGQPESAGWWSTTFLQIDYVRSLSRRRYSPMPGHANVHRCWASASRKSICAKSHLFAHLDTARKGPPTPTWASSLHRLNVPRGLPCRSVSASISRASVRSQGEGAAAMPQYRQRQSKWRYRQLFDQDCCTPLLNTARTGIQHAPLKPIGSSIQLEVQGRSIEIVESARLSNPLYPPNRIPGFEPKLSGCRASTQKVLSTRGLAIPGETGDLCRQFGRA